MNHLSNVTSFFSIPNILGMDIMNDWNWNESILTRLFILILSLNAGYS